jgi:dipeptidase E
MRHVIAAGGGDAQDSRPLDALLARHVPPNRPLLYLPIAMNPLVRPYQEGFDWLRSVFSPLGLHNIVMWTDVAGKADADLDPYAATYIGGGNTFTLMQTLKGTGFIAPLRRFIERGGIVYGGSAGAIILGRDIATAAHLDPNDAGLQDTQGLDLLRGYAIWCHYRLTDDHQIAAYVERFGHPVLALSERTGVSLRNDQLTALGYEAAVVFHAQTRETYAPSSTVPL